MMRPYLLLLSLALPSRSHAQDIIGIRDSLSDRVDSIFQTFDRPDAPGCAVGVYRDGHILYARGYGMANLELNVPITPRTVFNIASITKQFTATAVLLLAQEGRLSLDDPLRRYFPEMPPYASRISVRQMLNHTAGLREYYNLIRLSGGSSDVGDTSVFVPIITRSAETNFPPGTRFEYSNSDYVLAGQLVYRLSGRSLSGFLQEHLFEPLGMSRTHSFDDHTLIVPDAAQGYALRGTGYRISMSQFDPNGDGGMWTTVEDLARWDRNWIEPTVGGRALAESLVVRGRLNDGSMIDYALGTQVSNNRGVRAIHHGGADKGFKSQYIRFPDQHLSLSILCNLETADDDDLTWAVASVYLGARIRPDTTGAGWAAALRGAPAVSVPVERLRKLAGWWASPDLDRQLRISVESDRLVANGWGESLVPLDSSRFRHTKSGTELIFDGSVAGGPQHLSVRTTRGGTTTLTRMDTARLNVSGLAEYSGEYWSQEIQTTYTLGVEAALRSSGPSVTDLVIRIGGHLFGVLEPSWRDGFVVPARSANLLFTRDDRGRITGLLISRDGVHNLRFVRRP